MLDFRQSVFGLTIAFSQSLSGIAFSEPAFPIKSNLNGPLESLESLEDHKTLKHLAGIDILTINQNDIEDMLVTLQKAFDDENFNFLVRDSIEDPNILDEYSPEDRKRINSLLIKAINEAFILVRPDIWQEVDNSTLSYDAETLSNLGLTTEEFRASTLLQIFGHTYKRAPAANHISYVDRNNEFVQLAIAIMPPVDYTAEEFIAGLIGIDEDQIPYEFEPVEGDDVYRAFIKLHELEHATGQFDISAITLTNFSSHNFLTNAREIDADQSAIEHIRPFVSEEFIREIQHARILGTFLKGSFEPNNDLLFSHFTFPQGPSDIVDNEMYDAKTNQFFVAPHVTNLSASHKALRNLIRSIKEIFGVNPDVPADDYHWTSFTSVDQKDEGAPYHPGHIVSALMQKMSDGTELSARELHLAAHFIHASHSIGFEAEPVQDVKNKFLNYMQKLSASVHPNF